MKNFILFFSLFFFSTYLSAEELIIPRLSPLPNNIEKVELSGTWSFSPSFESKTALKPIEVPGEWVMQGFEVDKGVAAGYFRSFNVPSSWNGKRVKLRCNGVYSKSIIYINDKEAGRHLGGFTPFELDVTELVKNGAQNNIAVSVASESPADSASSASKYAVHPLGGITRDIYLYVLPEINLSNFHVSTDFDSTYCDAKLTAEVGVVNERGKDAKELNLVFTLLNAKGESVPLKNSNIKISEGAHKFDFDVKAPSKWDSEHPYLYTLTCELQSKGKTIESSSRRVGFRKIEVRGNEVFINNSPIKLRGVCRHEVMPLRGRSVNDGMWAKDVEIFRKANVNYIRTSHYPPDEALLEACDELGMLVEEEAPFCWAHESKITEADHYDVFVNQHIEMVNRDKSHPSVIMWSMGNESLMFAENFKKASEVVKTMDSTRPRIFSQWSPEGDNEELEVGNYHYPGPSGPDTYRNAKRPIVFDEYCHLNAYNRLELSADPGLRDKWGELLSYMWDDMYNSKGVLGGAIWAGIDDTFFLPGEKAIGYGTWGPIDGWRREKPEYWGMKKAYSPVKITLKENVNAEGELRFSVENRHDFSNLSECKISWKIGNETGVVSPKVSPKSKGEFKLKLSSEAYKNESIHLEVVDARGVSIDVYNFRIAPEVFHVEKKEQSQQKLNVEESVKYIKINVGVNVFTLNKLNGLLSVASNGEKLINSAPSLMILPLNEEGRGIQMLGGGQNFDPYTPVCENWTASAVEMSTLPGEVMIVVRGSYKEAAGCFIYKISANGSLVTEYDFTMKTNVSPRQIGLVYSVSGEFTNMLWDRNGFWNAYPENHISPIKGTAKLFDPSQKISGLAGPATQPTVEWALDQTESGSNKFRSTKECINSVTISKDNGTKLEVISDGTQHSRAWKEGSDIKLLIADYSNGGNDRFLTSHAGKDYKPLKRGDRITGKSCITF